MYKALTLLSLIPILSFGNMAAPNLAEAHSHRHQKKITAAKAKSQSLTRQPRRIAISNFDSVFQLSRTEINFGSVPVNSTIKRISLRVKNKTSTPITLRAQASNDFFLVSPFEQILAPGKSSVVIIELPQLTNNTPIQASLNLGALVPQGSVSKSLPISVNTLSSAQ